MTSLGLRFGGHYDGLPTVLIGGVDVSIAVLSAQVTTKVNSLAVAKLRLDYRLAGLIDFFGPVRLLSSVSTSSRPVFTGTVTDAVFEDASLNISAATMPELAEVRTAPFTAVNMPYMDLLHLLLRSAGLAEERIKFQDQPRTYDEIFEVVQPFSGMNFDSALRSVNSSFLPRSALTSNIQLGLEKEWIAEAVAECSGVAVSYVNGSRPFEAEAAARKCFAEDVAWLQVNRVYGGSQWPDGTPRPYTRPGAASRIRLADVILVRGLSSGRKYARVLEQVFDEPPGGALERELPVFDIPDRLSQSAQSLALAADPSFAPMIRIGAIWEALEYYAASFRTPALFTKSELREIRKRSRLAGGEKESRFNDLVGKLNQPPLMAKIRQRTESDRCPISSTEFEHLVNLRVRRNDATHGRGIREPSLEDINYGISIVSRMLVYARHRLEEP